MLNNMLLLLYGGYKLSRKLPPPGCFTPEKSHFMGGVVEGGWPNHHRFRRNRKPQKKHSSVRKALISQFLLQKKTEKKQDTKTKKVQTECNFLKCFIHKINIFPPIKSIHQVSGGYNFISRRNRSLNTLFCLNKYIIW